jgi:N-glycosylase/DNA lyase
VTDTSIERVIAPATALPNVPHLSWSDLPTVAVPLHGEPLALDQTLETGQAFRWRQVGGGKREGVAGGYAWRLLIVDDELTAQVAPPPPASAVARFLERYFRLDLPLRQIQAQIAAAHPSAADAVRQFEGMRILQQDPVETILSFSIATATNVPRVTRSIRETCARFGSPIAVVDGALYSDFPTPEQILAAPVDVLFGPCNLAYRARSIQAVARELVRYSRSWASHDLPALPYRAARDKLDALPGFGPKVADCVCLFGLGFDEAVPVDVHVWAIAHKLFGEAIQTRTLTPKTYDAIGERFRAVFGRWAGWAQQYLFCARRAIPIRQRYRPG